jgi:tetratricopeptide (TPR) repeat protein
MKRSRNLIFLAVLVSASPAFADGLSDYWSSMKSSVTTTVNGWIDYWKGEKPAESPNKQTAQKPAAPVAPGATQGATPDATSGSTSESSTAPAGGTAATPGATTAPTGTAAGSAPAAPAAPAASEEAKQLRAQPLYTSKAQNSSLKDVQSARDAVKAAQVLKVTPGREGTTTLPKSKAGVPVTNFAKMGSVKGVKKIPRLDIGTESLVSTEKFKVSDLHYEIQQPADFKKLPQPQPVSDSEVKKLGPNTVQKAAGPQTQIAGMRSPGKPVTMDVVNKINWTFKDNTEVKEMPYKALSEDQMKMLAALIIFQKGGHCPMVFGLFHELSGKEAYRAEATYHLGACAAELKLYQSKFDLLSKVVASENPDYASSALTALAKDLPIIYERDFFKLMKGVKNPKALVTDASHDDVNYRMAKGAYRSGEFKTAIAHAELVSPKYVYSDDARFLAAMAEFAQGDKPGALKKLQDLWTTLDARKSSGNANIRAVTTINLARMYFANKRYDKALEHYMQIPKDHPLWVTALIEQGWTQIALEDYAGAIGNMYSLHSNYFKAVYQPESFVVRSIGYLNICQYGDAYKTLSWVEKDYKEWLDKESAYLQSKSKPLELYSTVKSYIKGKSSEAVDGVPFQIWREMAHRKDFLNAQTALNDKVDESKRYQWVQEKMNEERASINAHADQAKKRFEAARAQVKKPGVQAGGDTGMTSAESLKNSQRLEREYTTGYRFQLALLEQSRAAYQDFIRKGQARLDAETAQLTNKAGEILLNHAKSMQKEMSRVIENNEFLRYEVFAGSGENIRYQVAGGETTQTNRIPASIKPQKMMNWNFDGEMWEDEIGSYRSGLVNNCPKTRGGVPGAAQAVRAMENK